MAENILKAKDLPADLVSDYRTKILALRAKGQTKNLPDLEYQGNYFFLDNKGGGKWSPKNRAQKYNTDAARRASVNDHSISRQEYRDFAKRNGYSQQQADMLYDQKETNLKQLQRTKGTLAYEHFTPTTSKAYGGVEHPRNLGHLESYLNGSKGDKLMSPDDARKLGIPLNKQSAIRMDFEGKPIADKTGQMQKVLNAVNKPGVVRAQTKNKKLLQAQRSRAAAKRLGPLSMFAAPAVVLATGGSPAEAAGAFVDSTPVIGDLTSDNTADGTRTANMNPKPVPSKPLGSVLFDQFRRGIDWYRNNMNAF